jgi:hypothetical protein
MEIQQINITRRMKTPKGWRFYPVVLVNGRIKPGFVMVDGKQVQHPEGDGNGGYYLDWTEPSEKGERKRVRIAAWEDRERGAGEAGVSAKANGLPAGCEGRRDEGACLERQQEADTNGDPSVPGRD